VAAARSGVSSNASLDPEHNRIYCVLFIGNSLTYMNDLPGTVAQLASIGSDSIEVESVARPNFALIDHVNGLSDAVQVIRSARWDYSVLQQGPSSLPISRDTLILATLLLDPEVRAAGARTAELMVWPAADNMGAFDVVRGSYQEAARAVDGLFLPAAEAWRATWLADSRIRLYGDDGFHPSELGTYLRAGGIRGKSPATTPSPFFDTPWPGAADWIPHPGVVRLLQHAAHETLRRYADALPTSALP